jgi:hypothetical protein
LRRGTDDDAAPASFKVNLPNGPAARLVDGPALSAQTVVYLVNGVLHFPCPLVRADWAENKPIPSSELRSPETDRERIVEFVKRRHIRAHGAADLSNELRQIGFFRPRELVEHLRHFGPEAALDVFAKFTAVAQTGDAWRHVAGPGRGVSTPAADR